MAEPRWWTHREDRRQAGACRIEAVSADEIVYHLAVYPLPIFRDQPRIALKLRCFEDGEIRMSLGRWSV